MTGPERLQIAHVLSVQAEAMSSQADFRDEVREAFRSVNTTLATIDTRTRSLETTRSQEEAVRNDRRDRDLRAAETVRWKIGAAIAVGSAVSLFLTNFLLPLMTH